MKRPLSFWTLGLLSCVMLSACFTRKTLVNPEVPVSGSKTQADVKQAVRQALTDYRWIIDKEEAGSTSAHLQQKELLARIRVDYNETHAAVKYVESKNFFYSKSASGQETIHSRYITWSKNIAERIDKYLNPKPPQPAK